MNELATVPYYVYEAEAYRCEKLGKTLTIVTAVSAAALVLTNLFWARRNVIIIENEDREAAFGD